MAMKQFTGIDYIWVDDFWDTPLHGTCRHNGQVCEFVTDDETRETTFAPLGRTQRVRWWVRQKWFEACVGKHFTYRNGRRTPGIHPRRRSWWGRALMAVYYGSPRRR